MDRRIEELARTLKTVARYSADCEDLLIQFLAVHPDASGEKICRAALYAATGRAKLERRTTPLLRELAVRGVSLDERSEIRPSTPPPERCRTENHRPSADLSAGNGGEADERLMSQKPGRGAKGRTAARSVAAEIETAALGVAEAVSIGLWSILAECDREQFRHYVRKARRFRASRSSRAATDS